MRLTYVFDPTLDAMGTRYLCRVPLWVAKVIVKNVRYYDYDPSPVGCLPDPGWDVRDVIEMHKWIGWRRMVATVVTRWGR